MRVEVALALIAPKVVGVKAKVSASVPQLKTPVFDAFTSQAAAERLATVSEVVVALVKIAPVALRKVEVAEVKLARVAKRFVEVALVEVEVTVERLLIVEDAAMMPFMND